MRVVRATAIALTGLLFLCGKSIAATCPLTTAPGRQPYTGETAGALMVNVADGVAKGELRFRAMLHGQAVVAEQPIQAGRRVRFPLTLSSFPQGRSDVVCYLTQPGKTRPLAVSHATVTRLATKPNVTKIDYVRRCLRVDDRPFFPVGFYCELPLGDLPDEAVIHGFNTIAPYRAGPAIETAESKAVADAYLDRCAAIGMKVVHDLRPVAERKPSAKKWATLRAEIESLRDHPALLCWLISDEPADKKIDPARLAETYRFIKKLDPFHPVTMVFCHFVAVHRYLDAMDFALLDYYPVPNHPVSVVADMITRMHEATGSLMPIWFVPQAFGGSWAWSREPSAREERVMTYLGLINGATGIQYFIRRPPNENPMSPVLWSECGRLALETAELAPALLSDQRQLQVTCTCPTIRVAGYQDRGFGTIIAVNTVNHPEAIKLRLEGIRYEGRAEVLFENRRVPVVGGVIKAMIGPLGTRVYRLPTAARAAEGTGIQPRNLTVNPSFESAANPGTPDGCYVGRGGRGATMFADAWTARHGLHSLRLVAPTRGGALRYTHFPPPIKKGVTYRVSVWAKARTGGLSFAIVMRDLGIDANEFALTDKWHEYAVTGTARRSTKRDAQLQLRFAGPGTAWFDLLQVVPLAAAQKGH